MRIKTYSVTEINKYISRVLEGDPILNALSIRGEISNLKVHSSGHAYFNLKDDSSRIPIVMFKNAFSRLNFRPKEGMAVIARGHITVYERDGRYQLLCHELEEEGAGDLHLKFLKLKQELQDLGYFDQPKKTCTQAKRVGVITSPTGAALQDFLSVLRRRDPLLEVVVYPALVQGVQAVDDLCDGITYFNESGDVDVIVLTRGGGSIEELWSFNERKVAECIYRSKLPVVAAIGHEVDFTIADFVSDLRAPTPTAAAELISQSVDEKYVQLEEIKARLSRALYDKIDLAKIKLGQYEPDLIGQALQRRLDKERLIIDHERQRLEGNVADKVKHLRQVVDQVGSPLKLQHPQVILGKGYALIKRQDVYIDHIGHVQEGDTLTIKMRDDQKDVLVKRSNHGD